MIPRLSRRRFLQSAALATTVSAAAPRINALERSVFQHGVASGDPTPNSVILWTRITPTPDAAPGSGLGPVIEVGWEISTDPSFSRILHSGISVTSADQDHTVHVDADALNPATVYFFRFHAPDGSFSPTGRTQTTTPSPTALKLAVASCANWEAGHFAAYGDIARRAHAGELDVLIFLGDYIYEYARGVFAGKTGVVRPHEPAKETVTLNQYRIRYGHYRTDKQLQEAHAALPWITMWDDHEMANNSWRDGAPSHGADRGAWLDRKNAARKAYLEWMPIRAQTVVETMYRSFTFGDLATLSILDLRSFRDAPPTRQQWFRGYRATTMMGSEQFEWLKDQVEGASSIWNIIGTSVMIAPMQVDQLPEPLPANLDQWDGYSKERDRLLSVLAGTGSPTLFLAGDIHSEWGNSIRQDGREIGVEIVCSSITSANVDDFAHLPENSALSISTENFIRANSSHVRHVDVDAHGYSTVSITMEGVGMTWHRVANIADPISAVFPAVYLEWVPEHGFTS